MLLYLFNILVLVLEFIRLVGQIIIAFFHRVCRSIWPPPKKSVKGQVVLITGGAQGLGRELAFQLSKLGAIIVLWDINGEKLKQTAKEIRRSGGHVKEYCVDVSDAVRVEQIADRVETEVGHVQILINNAAILHCKSILDLTPDEITKTINTNLLSHYWTVRSFLPKMLTRSEGHIVAISSNLGMVGKSHFCDYSAAKHAINGFMDSLADELRQMQKGGTVKLTTICPAVINTGLSKATETRFPWLFPNMSTPYAARKIIKSIQRNETFLVLPRGYRYLYACTRNFPRRVQQLLFDYIGNTVEID